MRRVIPCLFGKPYSESKFMLFNYWVGVYFYLLVMIMSIFHLVLYYDGLFSFVKVLLPAILFPLIFRIVYGVNVWGRKGKNKYILITIMAVFIGTIFITITIIVVLNGSSNRASFISKSIVDGKVHLTVGSLKGSYILDQFTVRDSGIVNIPYESSVQEGELTLQVKSSNTLIWEKRLSPSEKGSIEFDATIGNYVITINTDEAKKIEVKLSR